MSLAPEAVDARMAPTEHASKKWSRWFNQELWGQNDLDLMDHLVFTDVVGHNSSLPDPIYGPEEVCAVTELLDATSSDSENRCEQRVAEGDQIAQWLTATTTHEGTFLGTDSTRTRAPFMNIPISRVEDGKRIDGHEAWDTRELVHQPGGVTDERAGR